MSEHVYADPDIIKKVHFAQDFKEGTVDIYVSAESLRVYDNPWVEDTPGPAEAQQRASMSSKCVWKHTRDDTDFEIDFPDFSLYVQNPHVYISMQIGLMSDIISSE